MTVVYCRHRRSNHGDCVSVEYLLHHCAGVEHLLSVHVDDVSVAMVTLQQHLEHRQVDSSPVDLDRVKLLSAARKRFFT